MHNFTRFIRNEEKQTMLLDGGSISNGKIRDGHAMSSRNSINRHKQAQYSDYGNQTQHLTGCVGDRAAANSAQRSVSAVSKIFFLKKRGKKKMGGSIHKCVCVCNTRRARNSSSGPFKTD